MPLPDLARAKADRQARRALEATRADGESEQQHRDRLARRDERIARWKAWREVPF